MNTQTLTAAQLQAKIDAICEQVKAGTMSPLTASQAIAFLTNSVTGR